MNESSIVEIYDWYKQAIKHFDEGNKELDKIHAEIERIESKSDEKDRTKESCEAIARIFMEKDQGFLFHYDRNEGGTFRIESIYPIEINVIDSCLVIFEWESPRVADTIEEDRIKGRITDGAIVTKNFEYNGTCQVYLNYEIFFEDVEPSELAERVYCFCGDIRDDIHKIWPYLSGYMCS